MASAALHISALLLTFLGFTILLVTTVSSNWKICSTGSSVITAKQNYEGLWMHCTAASLGSTECKKFYYFLSLDITGFVFTLGGWVIVGSTLSNSYWKVSTVWGSVITTSSLYENLWHSCAEDSTGVSNCKAFDSLLALPAYIQACRALMITSLVLGVGGTLLALLGLKCTQLGSNDERTKARISMMSGMLFIIAGLSSMIAVSWYAARITAQFFDSLYGGTKYELGPALYLGWAGSILSIFGGILLMCSSSKGKPRGHRYHYAAAETVHEPQVCIKQSEAITSTKDYV